MKKVAVEEEQQTGRGVYSTKISGDNIELTESIREYVNEKVDHATSHFASFITSVDVHLSVTKNPRVHYTHTAQATVFCSGAVIRAEERTENLYASIDAIADKIERSLTKYKERKQNKHPNHGARPQFAEPPAENPVASVKAASPSRIVKKKEFPMPPMLVEDALECLDFLDHDFYVFRNAASGEINVVYERMEGGYGIIEPEK
eukprot:CAMPEP_0196653280 /NCGR_PEP_ID=MMETSP1086-20130531/2892_1 /TAXON_ID=77921 /ORGANISM="Cyanoptyche  gloeocystis , Strain SAG4.97" /LENGTH=203 /DNA_ID=CAMNT_0041984387 /DNA_START=271 /DNA_END=882 /DNA_ORIENTATION=-